MAGVYFLAIEAIGTQRLRHLREMRWRRSGAGPAADGLEPTSHPAQPDLTEVRTAPTDPGCLVACGLLGALTLALLFVALRAFGIDVLWLAWQAVGPLYLLTAVVLLFLLLPLLLLIAVLVGLGLYRAAVWLLHVPVSFLEFTERQSAQGTAGLLGFLLIIFGLLLQVLSNMLMERASVGQ
jgi:hypothetical protein